VWGGPASDGVPAPSPRVRAVVEVVDPGELKRPNHPGYCEFKPGFILSGNHPSIGSQGRWVRPKWEHPAKPMSLPSVFALIVDGAHWVSMYGIAVATLVPEPVGVPLIDQPHKLAWHKEVASHPDFESGYVRVRGGLPWYNYTEQGWVDRDWDALYRANALPW
jgi:hypothetical protein